MSLVWEELEQNPGTAPGVHEGASSTKGLALLQELAREITSGSVCPMMRGEKAGEHPGAFPQQMASRRLEAVWLLCLGREQRPGAWPAQSNYHLPATNLQLAVPKVITGAHNGQIVQDSSSGHARRTCLKPELTSSEMVSLLRGTTDHLTAWEPPVPPGENLAIVFKMLAIVLNKREHPQQPLLISASLPSAALERQRVSLPGSCPSAL